MNFVSGVSFSNVRRLATMGLMASSVVLSATAHAHNVRFWLSYQDAAFALLNGKQVGDELLPGNAVAGLTQISVGVMATPLVSANYGADGIMLAFDTTNTNGTGKYTNKAAFDAATQDKVLSMASLVSPNWVLGKALPGLDAGGTDIDVDCTALGAAAFSGSAGAGTSLRPSGIWASFGFGTGNLIKMTVGTTVRLATAKILIDQAKLLSFGTAYGDTESETGIQLFALANAASRSTYLGPTTGTGQGTTMKYALGTTSAVSPVAVPDAYSMNEDGILSIFSPGVLANDTDPENRTLEAVLSSGPAHASTFSLEPTGAFTYIPSASFSGTDSFSYFARNSFGQISAAAQVTITIIPVNHPPVIQPPTISAIDEKVQSNLQFTATDPQDNPANTPITFELVSGPSGATLSPTGLLSWNPTEAQGPGSHAVTVRATDSGTPALSATLTHNLQVREVNDLPNMSAIPSKTIDELREVKATASATDSDLPAQTITYGLRNAPAGMTIDPATGALKWIPSESQGPAIHLFYVTANDGYGTTETPVTYTVKEVNSAPELQPIDDILTVGDQVVEFECKVLDSDVPENAFGFLLDGAPIGATLGLFDGHFNWVPPNVLTPQDYYFKIKVIDNGIPNMTSEQMVRITVVPTGTQSPIEGKITLQDFKPSAEGQKVDFEVRNALGILLEVIPNISLGAGGTYSITSNQTGNVSLSVRGLTWLTAARYPVNLGSSVAKANFSLINGDVNGDDYVGTDDYLRLSQVFDASLGDSNYDRKADLDGDGYIGTDDYLIINRNFDLQGM